MTRTLYVFDVRDPAEYAAGHMPGAVSAPGGQLVQATDQYVGTLGARIVLVDDDEVRAVMTASWLKQMGWQDVFVLIGERQRAGDGRRATGARAAAAVGARHRVQELAPLVARNEATVIDLSLSPNYRKGHIPGAWFAIRTRLQQALPKIPMHGELVLTSEDGILAGLAAPEARALTGARSLLHGGNAAWRQAGLSSPPKPAWPTSRRRLAQALRARRRHHRRDERVPVVGGRSPWRASSATAPAISRQRAISGGVDLAANSGASFSTSAGPKCACGFDGGALPPAPIR